MVLSRIVLLLPVVSALHADAATDKDPDCSLMGWVLVGNGQALPST